MAEELVKAVTAETDFVLGWLEEVSVFGLVQIGVVVKWVAEKEQVG